MRSVHVASPAFVTGSRNVAAGLLVAVGLSACGGGSHESGHSLSTARACLDKAGYRTAVVKNRYFPGATNLRVKLSKGGQALLDPQRRRGGTPPGEYVFLVFEKDHPAALAAEKKALTLAVQSLRVRGFETNRATVKREVGVDENVFFYSTTGSVTKNDRAKITPCLT